MKQIAKRIAVARASFRIWRFFSSLVIFFLSPSRTGHCGAVPVSASRSNEKPQSHLPCGSKNPHGHRRYADGRFNYSRITAKQSVCSPLPEVVTLLSGCVPWRSFLPVCPVILGIMVKFRRTDTVHRLQYSTLRKICKERNALIIDILRFSQYNYFGAFSQHNKKSLAYCQAPDSKRRFIR